MGGRWPKVDGVAGVRRIDVTIGGDPWAELIAATRSPEPALRVSPLTLRALYAPAPAETAEWPKLPDGGVVTELRSRE
jgi:hypothetical protein